VIALDSLPDRRPTPPRAREAALVIGGGLLLIVAVVLGLLSLTRREGSRITVVDPTTSGWMPGSPYVGSRSCRECHPGEYALYTRSGHARTLHTAEKTRLAQKLDGRVVPDPERPDVTWSYALRKGRLNLERSERGTTERFVADYAFGSGHHATTFVTVIDPEKPRVLEHRLTHYTRDDSLGITPGQRAANPDVGTTPHGRELSPRETLKCFQCHATRAAPEAGRDSDTADLIANVTCERCHGPAQAHVEAARAGREDLSMPFGLGGWTAESQMALCGQCHRHPSKASPGQIRPDDPAITRFQPVGLMQSKCYTQSAGGLSCVTCHDPHARASSDRTSYEAVCLECHRATPQTICSVSPERGCIDCHMPRRDSGQKILFTDHWIRINAARDVGSQ